MLDDGMVAIDGKLWGTKLSGKHRRGDAAACSVPSKSVDRFSQTFTYDPLNRLTANTLGGVANQSWNLDSQGNWSSVTTNGVTQTRTANAQNQITSISGTAGTPVYDANGNMTTDQSGNTYIYNAWNQLVSVSNPSGQIIAQYTYNAMGYRVTESYPLGGNPDNGSKIVDIGTSSIVAGTTNYIYYDSQWSRRAGISARVFWVEDGLQHLIETGTGGTANSNATSQTVWSASYINAAVVQDTYSAGVIQPNSRLYFEQDANWNTIAIAGLASSSWQVTQRYVYSPYGTITVLNADWSTSPTGTQPIVNNLYQGMTLDPVTGLYYERNRNYDPALGRWINQDPLQYINGANTYQFVMSNPVNAVDSWGTQEAGGGEGEEGLGQAEAFPDAAPETPDNSAAAENLAMSYASMHAADVYNANQMMVEAIAEANASAMRYLNLAQQGVSQENDPSASRAEQATAFDFTEVELDNAEKALQEPTAKKAGPARAPYPPGTKGAPQPSISFPGNLPKTQSPGPGWEWRGQAPAGGGQGNWFNPTTGESLYNDMASQDHGPHWDYRQQG